MAALHLQRGLAAERLAAEYLKANGLEILARNLRCRLGELDLVCLDNDALVIVEVRQRGNTTFGGALSSVTWRKRAKIIRTTQYFLTANLSWRRRAVRFDVLAITGIPDGGHDIVWVKDAFRR
jgi:putative endonuclease